MCPVRREVASSFWSVWAVRLHRGSGFFLQHTFNRPGFPVLGCGVSRGRLVGLPGRRYGMCRVFMCCGSDSGDSWDLRVLSPIVPGLRRVGSSSCPLYRVGFPVR